MREPSRAVLRDMLVDVAKKEKVTLSTEAADLIAVAADGSFRDALSVLQKVLLLSDDTVGDVDEVATVIGAPKQQSLHTFLKAVVEKDIETTLQSIDDIRAAGVDVVLFIELILERVRIVMLLRTAPAVAENALASVATEEQAVLREYAKTAPVLNSQLALLLLTALKDARSSSLPHVVLEATLIEFLKDSN